MGARRQVHFIQAVLSLLSCTSQYFPAYCVISRYSLFALQLQFLTTMKVLVFVMLSGLIASSSAGFAAIKALGAEKTRTVLPPRVYLIPQNVYLPLIMPDTPALPYAPPPSYGPPQPYAPPSPPQPYSPPQSYAPEMSPPSYPSAPLYPSPPSYSPPLPSYDQSQY